MPSTKTNGLYEQAESIRTKADELLKLQSATNAFASLDIMMQEMSSLKKDLARTEKSILGYKYDIEKLDKKHPDYKEKLRSLQSSLVSAEINRDNYVRHADNKKASIVREEARTKEQVKRIEDGEVLPSSMSKSTLIKELLNKMTYGA